MQEPAEQAEPLTLTLSPEYKQASLAGHFMIYAVKMLQTGQEALVQQ